MIYYVILGSKDLNKQKQPETPYEWSWFVWFGNIFALHFMFANDMTDKDNATEGAKKKNV